VSYTFERWRAEPVLIVTVLDDGEPVKGVRIAATSMLKNQVLASGVTDDHGRAHLDNLHVNTLIAIEAVADEGPYQLVHSEVFKVADLPAKHELEKSKDFRHRAVPLATASTSTVTSTAAARPNINYGEPILTVPRLAQARLEIDWITGITRPNLVVNTTSGPKSIEELFRQNGIEVEVQWSDELPASVAGSDGRMNDGELRQVMARYRSGDEADRWHLYLVIASAFETDGVISLMFDDNRRGAALFVNDLRGQDARELVLSIMHEAGHEMNLPHPFQTYGDTRSVMTYPFRWPNWSYDDPTVYLYDAFGKWHIHRAPDRYVRPGSSKFLDYGATPPWENSAENGA